MQYVDRALASHHCGSVSIPGGKCTIKIMWVEFVVGSCILRGFFLGTLTPVFLPPQKPTFLNFNYFDPEEAEVRATWSIPLKF